MAELGCFCTWCHSVESIEWDRSREGWIFADHARGRLPCPGSRRRINDRRRGWKSRRQRIRP